MVSGSAPTQNTQASKIPLPHRTLAVGLRCRRLLPPLRWRGSLLHQALLAHQLFGGRALDRGLCLRARLGLRLYGGHQTIRWEKMGVLVSRYVGFLRFARQSSAGEKRAAA